VALWQRCDVPSTQAALERMRRILCTAGERGPLNPELSQRWFDICTDRMNAMKAVEDHLSADLRALCELRRDNLEHELSALDGIHSHVAGTPDEAVSLSYFDEPQDATPAAPSYPLGSHLDRSVLDLVQAQAKRLQAMSAELDTTRASLNERKLVERAKGLLMAQRQISEAEAHKTLRQLAMNQNRRLVDVAESVLALADLPQTER